MSNGYVILAQNTEDVDYEECAEVLRDSILKVTPDANVTILTELPYGDLAPDSDWKLVNDWQVYEASPYDHTIKLEADMFVPVCMNHYFTRFKDMHVCVCDTILDYRGHISDSKIYRKFTTDNNLPDVYNAITYFDKSEFSEKFFSIVRDVFDNWTQYKKELKCNNDELVTTDWAYAIACHIMGVDNTTRRDGFKMVHMKQFINNTLTEDWTRELVYELDPFRIQTIVQSYPVHYHVKEFASIIKDAYARV